jgi:hypothetical protein
MIDLCQIGGIDWDTRCEAIRENFFINVGLAELIWALIRVGVDLLFFVFSVCQYVI